MPQTVIILSKTQSASIEEISPGMSGYRVDLEVVQATNIDPKIFIFHREVLSLGAIPESGEPYEDTFYSVASVPELESLPEAPTTPAPFYRKNSVSLVFSSISDLNEGVVTILDMIERLKAANDLTTNLGVSELIGFPPTALSRFWGITTETSITDEILLAGSSDLLYSIPLGASIANTAGPRYVYFAIPASLEAITEFRIGGDLVDTVLQTRDVETVGGTLVSYRIYRTEDAVPTGTIVLEIS